jgi:Mn2+/Fe2+ NRAMP family transporter
LGIFFSSLQLNPIEIIKFAQVEYGILLPIIAIFLFWIVNKTSVLGEYSNTLKQNVLGIIIIGINIFLGAKSIYTVFQNF